MDFAVLTIFPELFESFWEHGIIRRAIQGRIISGSAVNIREFAEGKHRVTDDRPYGGGCGMVMKPEPLAAAIRAVREQRPSAPTVLLTPQGRVFDQPLARELATRDGLILVCGRYEGIDERISEVFIDYELSIGDYIMTGGELGAMVIVDAVTRLLPGALGGEDSADKDSFTADLLEHGHYTRPSDFEGHTVPEVLLSGNHQAIDQWRRETALIRTFLKRPDLLQKRTFDQQELEILRKWCADIEALVQTQSLPGADPLPGHQQER
ncbi:tRNA (guanosine(37)-N1)-methyltransferase TrmD [Thermodesulfobacteriota bacterium]